MRSVSDVLQNRGGTTEYVTRDGKSIPVQYLTLRHMSQYETRLQNRAIRTLSSQRDAMPEDVFSKMFADLMDRIAAGAYAFGGEVANRSLGTVQGVCDLVSILCGVSDEQAMELLVNEGEPFKVLFDEVVRKSVGSRDDEGSGQGN